MSKQYHGVVLFGGLNDCMRLSAVHMIKYPSVSRTLRTNRNHNKSHCPYACSRKHVEGPLNMRNNSTYMLTEAR